MIHTLIGDLFESSTQTLVNTVNCVGIMGKGIALEFKKRFPEMHEDYVGRCGRSEVKLGQPYVFQSLTPPWIINFPTKQHWRSVSRLSDIVEGLEYLERHAGEWGIESLAVPPLGCGLGGLEWRVVGPTLFRHLSRLSVPVELYAPPGTPPELLAEDFLSGITQGTNGEEATPGSRISPSWVALMEIVARIEREPYHWPVGRTVFQKVAYFATALGLPTGLEFRRGSFGPFSDELKPLSTKLANNGLLDEVKLGKMFRVRPGPSHQDAVGVFREPIAKWDPIIDRVADLLLRMTTNQAEVAATVHFAAADLHRSSDAKPTEREVLDEVMQWKQRRRPPLSEEQVAHTVRNLNMLRWIDARPSEDLPASEETLLSA